MEIEICGKFKVLVDAEDWEKISAFNWRIANCSRHNTVKLYVRCMTWRKRVSSTFYMHRLIMDPRPGMVVDHINGDGLDNRRCNLRICTVKENARHQKEHVDLAYKTRGSNGRFN